MATYENTIYKCIVVDDNEIDRLTAQAHVKKYPFLNHLKSFSNPEEALAFILKNEVDILFLDIDMPEMNGLQLKKLLKEDAVCIYITSHPEYAVESFDVDALDFMVKPIRRDRFDACMKKLKEYLEIKHKADLFDYSLGGYTITIKEGYTQIKIKLHEILYLEALKDYTRLITNNKKYTVLGNIGNLLKDEEFGNFIRIHKSFAIHKHYIQQIKGNDIMLNNGTSLPVGRKYKEALSSFI